jgi:hypothetical protein
VCQIKECAAQPIPRIARRWESVKFSLCFTPWRVNKRDFLLKKKCNTHAGQDISRSYAHIGAVLCAPVWFIHLQIDLSHARKNGTHPLSVQRGAHTQNLAHDAKTREKCVNTPNLGLHDFELGHNYLSVYFRCERVQIVLYKYIILRVTRQQVLLFLLRASCTWVRGNFTHSYLHVGTHYAPTTCVTKRQNVALLTQFWHFQVLLLLLIVRLK